MIALTTFASIVDVTMTHAFDPKLNVCDLNIIGRNAIVVIIENSFGADHFQIDHFAFKGDTSVEKCLNQFRRPLTPIPDSEQFRGHFYFMG